MAAIIPDVGEKKLLACMVGKNPSGKLMIHLYKEDYTPNEATVLTSVSEVDVDGYAAVETDPQKWEVVTENGTTTASYQEDVAFTTREPVSVYGYFITDTPTTGAPVLLMAERLENAPINLPGTLTLKFAITLD